MKYDVEKLRQEVIDRKTNRESIKKDILEADSFREAGIIAKFYLPPQSYGHVMNNWFRNSPYSDFKNLKSSDRIGDDLVFGKYNTEVKSSLCDDGKKYNYVQIRLTHDIHFYFLPTYDFILDKSYYFLLTKKEMIEMVKLSNGELSHGTRSEKGSLEENISNPDIEFCIRPVVGKDLWKELMKFDMNENDFRNEKIWENKLSTGENNHG